TVGNPNSQQIIPYAIPQAQGDQLTLQSGMKVCVIDSGLDRSNPDFLWSSITGDNNSGTGNWDDGGGPHGTHVAGTIAAANNTTGVIGMAPGVPLHIVKVFNADGWGYSSDLSAAAQQCITAGANIITMSLGGAEANSLEEAAFDTFTTNGGLVLASAGNDGDNSRSFPAGYKSVMMVGANDENNTIAGFSQYPSCTSNSEVDDGYCVEVTAGGVDTMSTYPSLTALTTAGAADEAATWGTATATVGTASDMDVIAMENTGSVSAAVYYFGSGLTTNASANGKICIIDRGTNTFHEKAKNCEDSGGIGAVIVNNYYEALNGTLGETNTTTIPVIGASLTDRSTWLSATNVTIDSVTSLYGTMSGTSMATPAVAGAAALVWSNHQSCTGTQIRDALKASAEEQGQVGKDDYYGYGIVKAKAASDYITTNGCSGTGSGLTANQLTNNVAKTSLGEYIGTETMYTMYVPADATNINFATSGGTGDVDMYIRYGSAPTTSTYDCARWSSGNNETCATLTNTGGTYYIMLKANAAYADVSLIASFTDPSSTSTPAASIDSTVTNIGINNNQMASYSLNVLNTYSTLTFTISGGTGEADLYVKHGAQSTVLDYDCRPYIVGNAEVCTMINPAVGTWYVGIRAASKVTGLSLNAKSN
ncbi:MAG: serine protease, partial [Phenylobacterium sp.]